MNGTHRQHDSIVEPKNLVRPNFRGITTQGGDTNAEIKWSPSFRARIYSGEVGDRALRLMRKDGRLK